MNMTNLNKIRISAAVLMMIFLSATAQTAAGSSHSQQKVSDGVTAKDGAATRALDAKFVKGWLDDDAAAVLNTRNFSPRKFTINS